MSHPSYKPAKNVTQQLATSGCQAFPAKKSRSLIAGVKILEQNLVRSYKNSKHLVRSDKILIRFFSWVSLHNYIIRAHNIHVVYITTYMRAHIHVHMYMYMVHIICMNTSNEPRTINRVLR